MLLARGSSSMEAPQAQAGGARPGLDETGEEVSTVVSLRHEAVALSGH
jgi:hypothetical protein